jgi:hypothetical protein
MKVKKHFIGQLVRFLGFFIHNYFTRTFYTPKIFLRYKTATVNHNNMAMEKLQASQTAQSKPFTLLSYKGSVCRLLLY